MAKRVASFRNNEISFNRPGARIANQMFSGVAERFSILFDDISDVLCRNEGRRFTERQAYGLLVRALLELKKFQPEFVLTEVPVKRNKSSSGCLDLLYKIRGQTFATELKVVHRGISGNKDFSGKIGTAWVGVDSQSGNSVGVVSQLKSMDLNEVLEMRLGVGPRNLKLRKFPLLIVCYHRYHQAGKVVTVCEEKLRETHENVFRQIGADEAHEPFLDELFMLNNTAERAHRNNGKAVTIAGFGFFGGARTFESCE